MSGYVLKEAGAEAICRIDWTQGYLEADEGLTEDLGWTVVPSSGACDLTVRAQDWDRTSSRATVAAGTPGRVYMVSARARTDRGRDIERALVLRVAD